MIEDFTKDEIDNLHKTIGTNVKKIRQSSNLSQLELSYKMGLKSVSLVSASEPYTNGKHFNIQHLYKIASICNTDLKDFFDGIDTKNGHNTP